MLNRLDCSFLFGVLVIVFAWLNDGMNWTRMGLLIVGIVIVIHSFMPCFCKRCHVEAASPMKTAVKMPVAKKKPAKKRRK